MIIRQVAALAVSFLSMTTAARGQGPSHDTEVWMNLAVGGAVSGRLLASADVSLRPGAERTRAPTTLARMMIGWQVSDQVTLWNGYVRVVQRPVGRPGTAENRLFQQIGLALGKAGPGTVTARTRLEQRMFAGGDRTVWRLRQQLRYALPVKHSKANVVLYTEPFLLLVPPRGDGAAGIEQWRNYAGLSVPLAERVSVDVGYLNSYVRRPGARDRIDHIVPLTLSYRL